VIKISSLSNRKNNNPYIFSDLHLDLQESAVSTNKINNDIVSGNDIIIDMDENAIRNSITNILSQRRYLHPKCSADLKRFIGNPATMMNANAIGNIIRAAIGIYEPRGKVDKILVSPNIDEFTYNIFLFLERPNLNKKSSIMTGVFNATHGNIFFR